MINELEEIPGYIRNMALMYYMRKCKQLYTLAYMQWMVKFPKRWDYYLITIIKNMIKKHIEEQWKPGLNINAGEEGLKLSEEF